MPTYNIRQLPKHSFSLQKEIPKYYLSYCQDKITAKNPTTKDWIHVVKTLKLPLQEYDKSRILLAKLEEHKDIVVKLGDDESIRKEYEYAKKLYRFKGFVKFICYFECNDNFLHYPSNERNHLCNGEGTQMKIIVMPYFEMGGIGVYPWTKTNISLLRSCIKHAILSILSVFVNGYLHGDFHPGNVLLKKTKQSSIDYDFDGIGVVPNIETNGVRTWIMDFENTREVKKKQTENKRDTMDFYYDLQKFFMLLQDHRFIRNIDKTTTIGITNTINVYMNNLVYPNMEFIQKMLSSIDKIELV
jgi:serine/threonine protein kinase